MVLTGIWKFLSRTASLSETNVIAELKRYFDQTRTVLGEKLFMELFFQVDKEDSYQDDLNELNRVSFLDDLHKAKELLSMYRYCIIYNVSGISIFYQNLLDVSKLLLSNPMLTLDYTKKIFLLKKKLI